MGPTLHEELHRTRLVAKPWRWSTGKRGLNRVTVYSRPDGASLYIEWWDDSGRHQKALTHVTGHPVTDKELAKQIAKDVAKEQERIANEGARRSWLGEPHTLGELFRRYVEDKRGSWSEKHAADQARFRAFWEAEIGTGRRLERVSDAQVERIAARAAKANEWSASTKRKYLMFIVGAFNYAHKKLKWIDARSRLSAVDMPSASSGSPRLAYSTEEALSLLDALHEVDARAAAVGEVALATGRRLNAIRNLPKAAYRDSGEVGWLDFPAATDKAGKGVEAAIAGPAKEAVEALLETDGPWLFPRARDPERPIRAERLNDMLHEAEKVAGIEHVKGRAWHGLKRRFASLVEDRRAASKQAATRQDTIERIYEQDDPEPKIRVAKEVARRRKEPTD